LPLPFLYLRAHLARSALGIGLCSSWIAACADPQFLTDGAALAQLQGDAGPGVDAALEHEAGAVEDDAGGDAAELDAQAAPHAGDEPVRTDAGCVDKPSVLGAECPGVVWCTDLGPCDQREKICCLTAFSAECTARSDCGLAQRASCDGPEDCHAGEVCCARDGIARCSQPADCPEAQRACHSEADCERNQCARGWPGSFGGLPVTYLADWGFCRTP
jgi:hypothetical protein